MLTLREPGIESTERNMGRGNPVSCFELRLDAGHFGVIDSIAGAAIGPRL